VTCRFGRVDTVFDGVELSFGGVEDLSNTAIFFSVTPTCF
jgi:hypothetical protein